MFVIDEAHTIEQHGRDFRPEFKEALHNMRDVIASMDERIPILAMSATYRKKDRKTVANCLGIDKPNALMRGPLARRNVLFRLDVTGDPTHAMKSATEQDLAGDPTGQQIWYTNTKSNAEGRLLDIANDILDREESKRGIVGDDGFQTVAMSLTGGDGIMQKVLAMDSFTNYANIDDEGYVEMDGDKVKLVKLQIMPATSATNCGVNSKWCKVSRHRGLPPNLYDVVQEMGRVDRMLNALPGTNVYVVHLCFYSVVGLFVRVMKTTDDAERQRQVDAMMEVLRFLLSPTECYHSFIERYFEEGDAGEKVGCGSFCSFCNGDMQELTGLFRRRRLMSVLSTDIFGQGRKAPKAREFVKALKLKKEFFFHENHVPKTNMGPIHALCLQLLGRGIIGLHSSDSSKIGTDKFDENDVVVRLLDAVDESDPDQCLHPAYTLNERWNGMTFS